MPVKFLQVRRCAGHRKIERRYSAEIALFPGSLQSPDNRNAQEGGFTLLLVVFVIAMATILVMESVTTAGYDSLSLRAFSEQIQVDSILKSTLNLSRVLLEMPNQNGINEDW